MKDDEDLAEMPCQAEYWSLGRVTEVNPSGEPWQDGLDTRSGGSVDVVARSMMRMLEDHLER